MVLFRAVDAAGRRGERRIGGPPARPSQVLLKSRFACDHGGMARFYSYAEVLTPHSQATLQAGTCPLGTRPTQVSEAIVADNGAQPVN